MPGMQGWLNIWNQSLIRSHSILTEDTCDVVKVGERGHLTRVLAKPQVNSAWWRQWKKTTLSPPYKLSHFLMCAAWIHTPGSWTVGLKASAVLWHQTHRRKQITAGWEISQVLVPGTEGQPCRVATMSPGFFLRLKKTFRNEWVILMTRKEGVACRKESEWSCTVPGRWLHWSTCVYEPSRQQGKTVGSWHQYHTLHCCQSTPLHITRLLVEYGWRMQLSIASIKNNHKRGLTTVPV